jgi:hypothetical protein
MGLSADIPGRAPLGANVADVGFDGDAGINVIVDDDAESPKPGGSHLSLPLQDWLDLKSLA